MTASWLVVLGGAWLAASARAAVAPTSPGAETHTRRIQFVKRFAICLWIGVLSSVQPVIFAQVTGLAVAWLTVVALVVIAVALISWLVWTARHRAAPPTHQRFGSHGRRIVACALALLVPLLPLSIGAALSMSAPNRLAEAGPILIGMIGIASLSSLLSAMLLVIPVHVRTPWAGVAYLAAVAVWTSLQPMPIDHDNPLLRETVLRDARTPKTDPRCQAAPYSLGQSLDERTARPTFRSPTDFDRTMYFVSAEGGGIRAAYWTALNLARLDATSRGEFGEQVALVSGVSGGSLGIATWLAARDRTDLTPEARLDLVVRYLSSDFLSPLVGGLMFLDLPRQILGPAWPSVKRDHVFEKALVDQWETVGRSDFFSRAALILCMRGFASPPAVFFNATDAQTGEYVPLSATGLPDATIGVREIRRSSIRLASVAQLVHTSARFPYLSPESAVGIDVSEFRLDMASRGLLSEAESEALIKERSERVGTARENTLWLRQWVLVDGGYFDNTALTPTRKAIDYVQKQRSIERENAGRRDSPHDGTTPFIRTRVMVVHISNDPGAVCLPLQPGWRDRLSRTAKRFVDETRGTTIRCAADIDALENSLAESVFYPLAAPLQSLLNVRTEHSRQAVADARRSMSILDRPSTDFFEISLAAEFADAFEPGRLPRWQGDLVRLASARVANVSKRLEAATAEVGRLVSSGQISTDSATSYLNQLSAWADTFSTAAKEAPCPGSFPPVGPPLGWTLSKANEALMQCMSHRSSIANLDPGALIAPRPPVDWPVSRILWDAGLGTGDEIASVHVEARSP